MGPAKGAQEFYQDTLSEAVRDIEEWISPSTFFSSQLLPSTFDFDPQMEMRLSLLSPGTVSSTEPIECLSPTSGMEFMSHFSSGPGPSSSSHGVKTEPRDRPPLSPTSSINSSQDDLSDSDIPKSKNYSTQSVMDMPFHKLENLDSSHMTEQEKSELSRRVRRAQNKMAAKTFRQHRLDQIANLQREVDHLKESKRELQSQIKSLQREIEELQTRCSELSSRRAQS